MAHRWLKPSAALRGLQAVVHRQHTVELHGDELRVDHAALGRAGVDVAPVDGHNGGGGVEILIFQLTGVPPSTV